MQESLRLSNHAQKNDNQERKIEAVNEKELEYKNDYVIGEGATYTGQMIQVKDDQQNDVLIKHGKGT